LNAFQKLDLSKCWKLQELITSIGKLKALENLDFLGVFELRKITYIYKLIECTSKV
jgi:hypothetical protein